MHTLRESPKDRQYINNKPNVDIKWNHKKVSILQKQAGKEERRTKNNGMDRKISSKMTDFNPITSIIH